MVEVDTRPERISPRRINLNLQFPEHTSYRNAAELSKVIADHLYEGVSELRGADIVKPDNSFQAVADVLSEKPLTPDDQLSDDEIFARAVIGTYLVSIEDRVDLPQN